VVVSASGVLGFAQHVIGIDADCATERDELGGIEKAGPGLVGTDQTLGQPEARGEFRLRQARVLAGLDQQLERGLVQVRIE
jgi:hypothetical protein